MWLWLPVPWTGEDRAFLLASSGHPWSLRVLHQGVFIPPRVSFSQPTPTKYAKTAALCEPSALKHLVATVQDISRLKKIKNKNSPTLNQSMVTQLYGIKFLTHYLGDGSFLSILFKPLSLWPQRTRDCPSLVHNRAFKSTIWRETWVYHKSNHLYKYDFNLCISSLQLLRLPCVFCLFLF